MYVVTSLGMVGLGGRLGLGLGLGDKLGMFEVLRSYIMLLNLRSIAR